MQRVAFVTGVSRGLGAALVDVLLQRGWEVVGIGRADAPAASRGAPGSSPGTNVPGAASPRYRFVAHDLADAAGAAAAVARVFAEVAARGPDAVVLVNNAAVAGPTGVLGRLGGADMVASLAVNLAAPVLLCDAFCRAFAGQRFDRRIVNVSSGAAERPIPGIGLYCVAKAGLEMLTRMLATEHAEPGFAAITLRPGVIDTDMQRDARSQSAETLPSVDLFRGFHDSGQLVPARTVAERTVARLVEAPVESGRTYNFSEL